METLPVNGPAIPPPTDSTRSVVKPMRWQNGERRPTGWKGDGVGSCGGSLVVHGDGSVAFCTAGCSPAGAAHALVTHRRFVPTAVLAGAIGSDRRFARALVAPDDPPPA